MENRYLEEGNYVRSCIRSVTELGLETLSFWGPSPVGQGYHEVTMGRILLLFVLYIAVPQLCKLHFWPLHMAIFLQQRVTSRLKPRGMKPVQTGV